jgi:glycosyltransferase involved in cell wall biosynthesis
MKIGIIICTYQREDGKTPFYLSRTLNSVLNQTYKNFKVFLIGDRYEDNDEFQSFSSGFTDQNLYIENLPKARERDVYGENKLALWSYAGTFATNYAITRCLEENISYICFLNHDDEWYEDHLQEIIDCIQIKKTNFICTLSTFKRPNNFLPIIETEEKYVEFKPFFAGLIHSSVCMNFSEIPLLHRDIYSETGQVGLPGDAELWERVSNFMDSNNMKGYAINKLTCRHDEEGYVKEELKNL